MFDSRTMTISFIFISTLFLSLSPSERRKRARLGSIFPPFSIVDESCCTSGFGRVMETANYSFNWCNMWSRPSSDFEKLTRSFRRFSVNDQMQLSCYNFSCFFLFDSSRQIRTFRIELTRTPSRSLKFFSLALRMLRSRRRIEIDSSSLNF